MKNIDYVSYDILKSCEDKIMKKKKIPKAYLVLLILSILLIIPAMMNGGIHGDDSTFHIINITAMNKNATWFHLPTRIRPFTANNFGYGSGIFYPELIHLTIAYLYKAVKHINLSLTDSITIFILLLTWITGIIMRKLLYKLTKDNKASTLGAIFYITSPYFLADIYRRSAYGELISFLALPLIFLGLYELLYKQKKAKFYICFILGYYLLFGSHLISVIYGTIFTGFFLLCQGKKTFKKENLISLAIASIFSLLLSLTFIVPIFEHKIFGNYMVFQKNYMYSRIGVIESRLPISELIIPGQWLTSYIPIFEILLIGILIKNWKQIKEKINKNILNGFLIISLLSTLLITCSIPWKIAPQFLLMIQFAWRNSTYLAFSICILSTLGYQTIKENHKKGIFIILLILIAINTTFILTNPNYTITKNTTIENNQRDGGMGWSKEYLPENTYKHLSYFENREEDIKIKEGNATVNIIKNNTPNVTFQVKTKNEIIVEIPRLYYLWYQITLKNQEEEKILLNYYENSNGFIEFKIPESGEIEVKYQKTKVSKVASIISTFSIGIVILWILIIYKKEKKNHQKSQ